VLDAMGIRLRSLEIGGGPYPVRFWFADGLRLDTTAASQFQTLSVFTENRVFFE
jgi:hypothetical protein